MARSILTAQVPTTAGITPTFGAADVLGSAFVNNGKRYLEVKNTSGSPVNVTIANPALVDGQAAPARVVSVPATTGDKMIGPFPSVYTQPDGTNQVYVDFSAVTSVTVALFEIAPAV